MKLKGKGYFELRKDGKVIDKWKKSNIIVNDGLERIVNLIGGLTTTSFANLAIGTGTTASTINDTQLETEVTRLAATVSYEASNKIVFEKTFTFSSGESYAITEVGIVDSLKVSGSVLLDRITFAAKNVDSDIDLYVKLTIEATN